MDKGYFTDLKTDKKLIEFYKKAHFFNLENFEHLKTEHENG